MIFCANFHLDLSNFILLAIFICFLNKVDIKQPWSLAKIQTSDPYTKHYIATWSKCQNLGGGRLLSHSVLGVGDDFLPHSSESHVEEEEDEDQYDCEGEKSSGFSAVLSLPVVPEGIGCGKKIERSKDISKSKVARHCFIFKK